jgi:hypothetical protein
MDADAERLSRLVEEMAEVLLRQGVTHWGKRLARDARRIRRSDAYGLIDFIQAFGGMGSLNDIYFHPENANAATLEEAERLNAWFEDASEQAYVLALAMRGAPN